MTQAMTFNQVKEITKKYLTTETKPNFVLCIVSSPGMGKTTMVKNLANELGLRLVTVSASSITRQTFALSFVVENKLTTLVLDALTDKDTLLFVEEIDRTPTSVAPILLPILAGRTIGNVSVNCHIVTTANYPERIESIDPALPTRLIFVHLQTEVSEVFQYIADRYAKDMDETLEKVIVALRMTCDNFPFDERYNPRQIDHLVEIVSVVRPTKIDNILTLVQPNLPKDVYETFTNNLLYEDIPSISDGEKYLDFIFTSKNPVGKHFFALRKLILHISQCTRKDCNHPTVSQLTRRIINATPTLIDTFTSALLDIPEDKRAQFIDEMMKTKLTPNEHARLIETLDLISRLTRQ